MATTPVREPRFLRVRNALRQLCLQRRKSSYELTRANLE